MRTRRDSHWLIVLLGAFLALGVVYSLVTPILEASDELYHYPVVKHIADGLGLPVQTPGVDTMWHQEGSQPPAYYALAALATAWINTDGLSEVRWLNPLANIGKPLAPGNKNMVIHTDGEAFPWRGTTLAIHLIRFLSLLLGMGTVYFTYRIALEIAPRRSDLALGAAALVAFNPMFLFISGSVNNDNLIVLLSTLALWLLVRTLREGWLPPGRLVALGFVLGLAALTKLSGLTLLPLTAIVLTVVAIRRRAWGTLILWGAVLGVFVAAIAGWWYLRNWRLYGDPSGLNMMLAIAGRRPEPWTVERMLREFEGFRLSYWGVFGGYSVLAWRWLYRCYDILALAGLVGWAGWYIRRRRRLSRSTVELLLVLVAWTLAVLFALIRWTSQTYASQGRLLFPAIGAIAVLVMMGLAGWFPSRWQARCLAAVAGLLFFLAAVIPFAIIRPAYARPPILTVDQIPSNARRVDVTHGDTLRMLAYELPKESVHPGEYLPVTVYWQAVAHSDRDLSVFVHLLGRNRDLAGQIGTYPGVGAYPTSLLRPGDVVRDTYQVPVSITATVPTLLRVDVGAFLYRKTGGETGLSAVGPEGQPAETIIGTVRLLPAQSPVYEITHLVHFDLDGQAVLLGYDLPQDPMRPGASLPVTLYWQALGRMGQDYQVFVHLMGLDGKPLAQGDKAPLDGDWPTTAWEPGQPVRDVYTLRLPETLAPGAYELRAGLYRLADGTRVPVTGPAGRVADSAMIIGQVQVR